MRGILSFIVVLGALFDTGHCASCPDGYTMNPDSGLCYKVMTVKRNWNEANVHCQTEGAELASIKSSDEWQFVKGLLNSTGINQRVWINGKDETNEGTWLWTDGSLVSTFSDWYTRRPAKDTTRNCITLMEDREWRWHDVDCSSIRYSVCKRSVECNTGYVDFNTGTCYKYLVLTDKGKSWYDRRAQCQEAGGDLASIKTSEEWKVVKDVLTASGLNRYIWLGGSDEGWENNWRWTDGSPVSFSDWTNTSPKYNTNSNCMMAHNSYNWTWQTFPCDNPIYAVCKIPVIPLTTSPATTCPPAPTCPPVTTCPITTTCPSCPTCPPVTTVPTTIPGNTECSEYNILNETDREISNGGSKNCDKAGVWSTSPMWKGASWYRFLGCAGTKLAQSTPGKNHCGTWATGWTTETLPTVAGSTLNIKICFDIGDIQCYYKAAGKITNCGNFFVYYLPNAPACNLRYCGAN